MYLLTFSLAIYLAYLLTVFLAIYLWDPAVIELPVAVRQCPVRSGAHGRSPAVPSAIWSSRSQSGMQCPVRSGAPARSPACSAQCDLELPLAVRQCPVRSGTPARSPAVPSATWTARRTARRRRRRRRRVLIKSNNPHLAGGEILDHALSLRHVFFCRDQLVSAMSVNITALINIIVFLRQFLLMLLCICCSFRQRILLPCAFQRPR